jgi:hypothetical protein
MIYKHPHRDLHDLLAACHSTVTSRRGRLSLRSVRAALNGVTWRDINRVLHCTSVIARVARIMMAWEWTLNMLDGWSGGIIPQQRHSRRRPQDLVIYKLLSASFISGCDVPFWLRSPIFHLCKSWRSLNWGFPCLIFLQRQRGHF